MDTRVATEGKSRIWRKVSESGISEFSERRDGLPGEFDAGGHDAGFRVSARGRDPVATVHGVVLESGVEGESVGDIPDHLESIGDCAERGEAEIGGVERPGDAWWAGGGSERSIVEIVAIEIGGGLVVKTQPRAEYDLFSSASIAAFLKFAVPSTPAIATTATPTLPLRTPSTWRGSSA